MERYRTEKRKANVGERILVKENNYGIKPSAVGVVTRLFEWSVFANFSGTILAASHPDYEVIIEEKPKGENEMTMKPLTDYSYGELLEAIRAKAQAEVKPRPQVEIAGEILRRVKANFDKKMPDAVLPQVKRDLIVERAKRDVMELTSANLKYGNTFDFIANKQKRTVVSLGKIAGTNVVVLRGIAKCDPSDCFNAHIGKAIALRHALGLEVPSEYLNAPQPTEVRVGDFIRWNSQGQSIYKIEKIDGKSYDMMHARSGQVYTDAIYSDLLSACTIIDDTREGK